MVETRGVQTYALGRSKRFLLGEGTMVPVEEADEADEEESLGEVARKLEMSSCSSSCSSKMMGSGGMRLSCALAKERCRSLMTGKVQTRSNKASKSWQRGKMAWTGLCNPM